ncbi:LOW QUALITY PROTEIN: hypothetical protein PHMEG_0007246 [Phytophthora megakarya]|uniref:Uncharacterized protein n=1 Tax=Phytophthora megakarya TaxID=4795 RepID=A0A225WN02_9STRA|nr:LOW QUALITY PROTEIN: hypothetical protein PHMEG_0007246 [Phytophthora megakarya]
MDEATKIVTFVKDGPVKTYLFREYPSTHEDAITLAMQEGLNSTRTCHSSLGLLLRQKVLNQWSFRIHQLSDSSRKGEATYDASDAETWVTKHVRSNKKRKGSVGKGCPTGNAVTRVYNGHAVLRTAAPNEREYHYEVQDDMPNLVILKVKSMTKRADSLRQCLTLLAFEKKHVPGSQLKVRLATGAIVKTEKRKKRRRKHNPLSKTRAGIETLQGMPARQTQEPTVAVETVNVSPRACARYQYKKMELENPPTDTS